MLDFAALPPEVNSGLMYTGAGPAPLLAAAAAWNATAAELFTAAAECTSLVSGLGDAWSGPAAVAMTQAATRYVEWLHQTATGAEQVAGQAEAAAAAYESAFAAIVPPPVIAANRSLWAALVATNFFGQNAATIAATDALYAEMWAQDAATMYAYLDASAAAAQLTAFNEPPPTAGPSGASQATPASILSSPLLGILEHVPNLTNSTLSSTNAATSARNIFITNWRLAFQADQDTETAPEFGAPPLPQGSVAPALSAGLARAVAIGRLSAPPSWAGAAPEIRMAALASAESTVDTPPAASAFPGNVFSQSALGTLSGREPDRPRVKSKPVLVRSPAAG